MARMDSLPSEIIFQICRYLEPRDIVTLQHINKRFLSLGRDETLWREQCFNASSFLKTLRYRRELAPSTSTQEPQFRHLARALVSGTELGDSPPSKNRGEAADLKAKARERIRIIANWDPSYPDEKVSWYDEYIARNAPISASWLQQPRHRESPQHEYLEIRGFGLYTPQGEDDSTLVVGPLDDGSICLWDISRSHGKRGSIVARSKPGILSVDKDAQVEAQKRSKMINTGVTECVSVDSMLRRAYFAVQSGLVEVDLETLSRINHDRFPFSITTLSEAKHPTPLTVGTNLALYFHDARMQHVSGSEGSDQLDSYPSGFGSLRQRRLDFQTLLTPEPSPIYAHLYHPGPVSILHVPSSGSEWDGNGEIYVAGRFPSILSYDRRYFPKLRGTIYSGARLSSMAWLPYSFSSMEKDLARRGELSVEQVLESKKRPGKTLVACGEYNTKGSLEMYGLSSNSNILNTSSDSSAGSLQNSSLKNRQTSAASKLLSVSNHGTRIVVSDGGGNIKWLERDGFTLARSWNIGFDSPETPKGIFGTLVDSYLDHGSGDIVFKMVNTYNGGAEKAVNESDLIVWTGAKVGLLSFSNQPSFTAEKFEEIGNKTPEQRDRELQERTYSAAMRRALEANANEVRYMRGFGVGLEEL